MVQTKNVPHRSVQKKMQKLLFALYFSELMLTKIFNCVDSSCHRMIRDIMYFSCQATLHVYAKESYSTDSPEVHQLFLTATPYIF